MDYSKQVLYIYLTRGNDKMVDLKATWKVPFQHQGLGEMMGGTQQVLEDCLQKKLGELR